MKRRSRAGGEPIKGRRRKAPEPKRRNVAKAIARSNSSPTQEETQVARLTRERDQALEQLSEALEQHTATSEVLRIISSSPGELEPVFQAMLENATRICEATYGTLYLCEGDGFRTAATHNLPPAYIAALHRDPVPPPDAPVGTVARTKRLKAILDDANRISTQILTNANGRLWTSDGFRTSWGKTCTKAGLASDLHFHDLRGSAVVRLALAEATVPQIATFTGHSLKDVEAILDKHYLGRDVALAEDAVRKLERKEKRTKSVKGR